MLRKFSLLALLVLMGGVPSAEAPRRVPAGDWPDARGPNRDGTSQETGLIDKWALNGENFLWRVPLGSMRDVTTNCALCHGSGGSGNAASPGPIREQAPQLAPMSGSPSLGGPIVTAGGLVFIAGTVDPHLRAFDVETGKELWNAELPASGHATPMTYRLSATGKQYVVIAAGGHAKVREEKQGDALVAFALP